MNQANAVNAINDHVNQAMCELAPLLRVLDKPIRVFPPQNTQNLQDLETYMEAISKAFRVANFSQSVGYLLTEPNDSTSIEIAINQRLMVPIKNNRAADLSPTIETIEVDVDCEINCYQYGNSNKETIILVIPCGMPAQLGKAWATKLSNKYHVITWETRGMFGNTLNFDNIDKKVSSQAKDLIKVLDFYKVHAAHVMGICGGAAIAMMASAESPQRVHSLSLWHGDLNFGEFSVHTPHQKDVLSMLSKARLSREKAEYILPLFSRPSVLRQIPQKVAHYILYPFASHEMLYRYGCLNSEIMSTDLFGLLSSISCPTLIVTSKTDKTAHPDNSIFAHENIKGSELYVTDTGDHLSMFEAPGYLVARAIHFFKKVKMDSQ